MAYSDQNIQLSPTCPIISNQLMLKEVSAILGAGCFWCVEAQFQRVKGVLNVVSGYAGGKTENPTYKQVCSGTTGHIEVIKVAFDPTVISYDKILQVFFVAHDPTQVDGQGYDIGSQYLSAIFYLDQGQKSIAHGLIKKLQEQEKIKIATKVLPLTKFWPAEEYHQNYYNLNGSKNPYCNIIPAKINKIKKYFKDYFVE